MVTWELTQYFRHTWLHGYFSTPAKISIAPEVMFRSNHTHSVDYYALGVITYEFMFGRVSLINLITHQRPYGGKNRKEIRDNIFAKQAKVKGNEIPDDWSVEAGDFIN